MSTFDSIDVGHCILLIEDRDGGGRTFSEYPTVEDLQTALIEMYENYREETKSASSMSSFLSWMDGFSRIEAFTYDSRLGRYHQVSRASLKGEFEEKEDGSSCQLRRKHQAYDILEDGHGQRGESDADGGRELGGEVEDWDD